MKDGRGNGLVSDEQVAEIGKAVQVFKPWQCQHGPGGDVPHCKCRLPGAVVPRTSCMVYLQEEKNLCDLVVALQVPKSPRGS